MQPRNAFLFRGSVPRGIDIPSRETYLTPLHKILRILQGTNYACITKMVSLNLLKKKNHGLILGVLTNYVGYSTLIIYFNFAL